MAEETCKIFHINKDTKYTLCYAMSEHDMKCIDEDNKCYFESMSNGNGYNKCREKRYKCLQSYKSQSERQNT